MKEFQQLERLRAELRRPGRSQTDLAKHLGLHPSAVNKMLAGKRDVKARELALIEDYLRATNSNIDEVIRRAEEDSPHRAAAIEVNAGISSTFYPGPLSGDRDLTKLTETITRLVGLAIEQRDPVKLIVESWMFLNENIKQSICERLRSLEPDDFDHLVESEALEDFILVRSLIVTFGILNEEEAFRVGKLRRLANMMTSRAPIGDKDVGEEVTRLLGEYGTQDHESESRSLGGRILATTLNINTLLMKARMRHLEQMTADAEAVRRRRKSTK